MQNKNVRYIVGNKVILERSPTEGGFTPKKGGFARINRNIYKVIRIAENKNRIDAFLILHRKEKKC